MVVANHLYPTDWLLSRRLVERRISGEIGPKIMCLANMQSSICGGTLTPCITLETISAQRKVMAASSSCEGSIICCSHVLQWPIATHCLSFRCSFEAAFWIFVPFHEKVCARLQLSRRWPRILIEPFTIQLVTEWLSSVFGCKAQIIGPSAFQLVWGVRINI